MASDRPQILAVAVERDEGPAAEDGANKGCEEANVPYAWEGTQIKEEGEIEEPF